MSQRQSSMIVVSATFIIMVNSFLLFPSSSSRCRRFSFVSSLSSSPSSTSSSARRRRIRPPPLSTNKKIAVIGGGPSGIFSSIFAASASASTNAAATTATDNDDCNVHVTIYESGSKTLTKVKISGGGRCNVLHDVTKPIDLILKGYPRGSRELTGLYSKRFTPAQMKEWFENAINNASNNVNANNNVNKSILKTETDGRMFPSTDDSQTIIDALLNSAAAAAAEQNRDSSSTIRIKTRCKVQSIIKKEKNDDGDSSGGGYFEIEIADKKTPPSSDDDTDSSTTTSQTNTTTTSISKQYYDAVILATGSAPFGYELAKSLGHTIVKPVPSLFTLSTAHDVKENELLHGLAGLSVPYARISYTNPVPSTPPTPAAAAVAADGSTTAKKKRKRKKKSSSNTLQQDGPLLITHHGFSGPAALRLSAFGAREMATSNYKGQLTVNWAPLLASNSEQLFDQLWKVTLTNPKKCISTSCPLFLPSTTTANAASSSETTGSAAIPKRLWSALVKSSGIESTKIWGEASKKSIRKLSNQICDCHFDMTSKGKFKDEFVTAGGVDLKQVNMKTMESRICPGLFFCGELLNIDGITGGYNFMNCWGTGNVAGTSAGEYVLSLQQQQQQRSSSSS